MESVNRPQFDRAAEMKRLLAEGTIYVDEVLGAADDALVQALKARELRP